MKEEEEQERESSADQEQALQEHRWTGMKLIKRAEVSPDTRSYTFALPEGKKFLGLGNGQHIEVGFHMLDKMLIRPYTPTKPLLPAESEKKGHFKASDSKLRDGQGTFELTVKTYFPDQKQPGGAMSNILDTIAIGQEIDIRGPKGEIICKGCGIFDIEGKERRVSRVSFVMGGTGITPCYSIIQRIMSEEDCKTEVRVLDANNTEADILLREEMESLQKSSNGRMKIAYVLAQPPDDWKGLKGFVTKDMMEEYLFPPADGSIALVCGPPPMIKKAVIPGLTGECCLRMACPGIS
jgi:nitrate reductase (NAD(P)H)